MAWRVIVRFSLDSDQGSRVRNAVAPLLNACGVQNAGTGTWESSHANEQQAADQLKRVLDVLSNPTAVAGASPQVFLDHLWVYIDRPVQ